MRVAGRAAAPGGAAPGTCAARRPRRAAARGLATDRLSQPQRVRGAEQRPCCGRPAGAGPPSSRRAAPPRSVADDRRVHARPARGPARRCRRPASGRRSRAAACRWRRTRAGRPRPRASRRRRGRCNCWCQAHQNCGNPCSNSTSGPRAHLGDVQRDAVGAHHPVRPRPWDERDGTVRRIRKRTEPHSRIIAVCQPRWVLVLRYSTVSRLVAMVRSGALTRLTFLIPRKTRMATTIARMRKTRK